MRSLRLNLIAVALVASLATILGQDFFDANNPLVQTNYGRVRGYSKDIGNGRSAASFIGIPFAASPTRGYRFLEPQAPARWQSDFDATNNRVSCLQTDQRFERLTNNFNIREDEDCLYLNVFVPLRRTSSAVRLPVVVYFHGGEFKYGGKDYYKPDILLQQDIILVVPNYRLGVLGFLGTDDDHSPGNFGLKDQIAALRWVRNEIQGFGGDASMVTIMGHDAGAISVNILMFAPDARGLFNRSISSGGTIFTPWAFQEDPYYQARDFGRFFNCHSESRRLVKCLRDKSASELTATSRTNGYHFRPVIDKNTTYPLLKDYPMRLYERNEFAKVPYLAGLTKTEGALDYYLRYNGLTKTSPSRDNLEILLAPYLRRYTNVKVVASAVDYQYFQRFNKTGGQASAMYPGQAGMYPDNSYQSPLGSISRDGQFVEIMGDFLYNAPTDLALKLHSRSGQLTYLYVLTYVGSKTFGTLQRDAPRDILRDPYGVTHMDDVQYIFPNEYNPQELDQYGKSVSTTLTRCLYQFMYDKAFAQGGCNFKAYNYHEQNYLNFGQTPYPGAAVNFRSSEQMSFWNDLIYNVIQYTATPPPYFPYTEYDGFRAATWSMVAFVIILVLVVAVLASVLCLNKRNDKRSLKLLRARDKELDERYNES
ncbi:Venom carboxylesterase-6 [Halotydeus destructor]|nr:Venom carboxylesterase-6 [Halotydeus destructor]